MKKFVPLTSDDDDWEDDISSAPQKAGKGKPSKTTTGRRTLNGPAKIRWGETLDEVTGTIKTFGGGKAPITRALYNTLVDYFRAYGPDNFTAAARFAGCNIATAKRAWNVGWPKRKPPYHAIKEVLTDEGQLARRERARAIREIAADEAKQTLAVINDVNETRAQEGLLVRDTRTVAAKLLGQTVKMVNAADILCASLIEQISEELIGVDNLGRNKSSVSAKLAIVERVARFAQNTAMLTETAMNLERKFMGDPEKVLGIKADMGVDEIVAELMAGQRDLARLTGRDIIALYDNNDFDLPTLVNDTEDE